MVDRTSLNNTALFGKTIHLNHLIIFGPRVSLVNIHGRYSPVGREQKKYF